MPFADFAATTRRRDREAHPVTRRHRPGLLTWTYDVAPATPMVWREVVSESACGELINYWRHAHDAGHGLPSAFNGDVPPAELVMPPPEYTSIITDLLSLLASHFGLPFALSSAQAVLARYPAGAGTEWHLDAVEGKKKSDRRTVSFTMLLNAAFDGGDLETDPGGPVDMAAGDVCGFTSRTWHRVAPVRSGERFALIAFGGFGEAI
jgi:hypothetical protein